jgi:hypothetical protein
LVHISFHGSPKAVLKLMDTVDSFIPEPVSSSNCVGWLHYYCIQGISLI